MKYQILINQTPFIDGNVLGTGLLTFIFLLVIVLIIIYIVKRLKENSSLKYEFITIIAHKFRTPLSSIKWLLESTSNTGIDPYVKQNIEDIRQSNQKLIDLTNTLIELTDSDNDSKASYALEKISLFSVVKEVGTSLMNSFHEKNLSISIEPPQEDILVNADKIRLEFVIQTILENACIYTPPGRNVTVATSISYKKATVAITDNGIGIDEKDIHNIFSKFYRTQNAAVMDTEGIGIGLYLAQSIMKRHNGSIKVSSEGLNRGATFSIIIPIVK